MAPQALRPHYKALSCCPLIPNIFLWFSPYFQQVAKTTSWSLLHVCCQICGLTSVQSSLNNMLALYNTALPWSTNIRCVAIHLIFLSHIIESWTKPRNMHSSQEHYRYTQFYIIRIFRAYYSLCMYKYPWHSWHALHIITLKNVCVIILYYIYQIFQNLNL